MNSGNPSRRRDEGQTSRDVVFSLGSNLGDCVEMLRTGVTSIARTSHLSIVSVSPAYRTVPVDAPPQPDFFNLIVLARSPLTPTAILERTQAIERACGRVPDPDHGARPLDIDLIKVGDLTSDTEHLRLPHPRAAGRAFVLIPWLDIQPDAELLGRKVADLAAGLDLSGIAKQFDIEITA